MKFLTPEISKEDFSDMGLSAGAIQALESLKINRPTPIQAQGIPVALTSTDMIGIAETGSGKTLVYALAILTRLQNDPTSRALVLTPSRETADQIFNYLEKLFSGLGISTCLVVAGMPDKKQVSQLNKLPRFIVATPGRLLDHLSNNKLLLQKLSILVVDEADRMLDEGFGPQLKRIRATLRGEFQTMMFAASFSQSSQTFAQDFFRPICYLVRTRGAEKPVDKLRQIVIYTEGNTKKERLLEALKITKGQCVVFVNDQPHCEIVHKHLSDNGFAVDVIHGGFKHGHRERVIRDFRDEKFRVLVTTDLLARGLDVPNISCVVNFDLPVETEDFLHRIGRTARAGKGGTAVTLVSKTDDRAIKKFQSYLENAEELHR